MPTRHGWLIAVSGVTAVVLGRTFGVLELYVIGAGLLGAVLCAVVTVRLRRPTLVVDRWIHPPVLTVGETGQVDLTITNTERATSPRTTLVEAVGDEHSARLSVAPLAPTEQVAAGYRVPTHRRGVLTIGPLEYDRRDLLGLAVDAGVVTGEVDVMVAPQVIELPMPSLGHGVLGRHLLAQSRRLGQGEFHSLRDYVRGDDLRNVHWRASARSDELKVRQHTAEGVRRCVVVLDTDADAYRGDDPDAFERAVTAAASLVHSSALVGLTTRFVAAGLDLRGPEVATHTLEVLAAIQPGAPLGELERDPGEGLGLVIVVTTDANSSGWRRTEQALDPSLTRLGVFTRAVGTSRLAADATSIERFRRSWAALAGTGSLDHRHLATSAGVASLTG